ncbi:hypothetical protein GCM10023215_34130 [Pseudonocardia yuanmonensis]|uniref:Uncharacterized protein n=1 Tax=Pseudonocardia yuanmonensis TaxID=1095914 RepID=A0ABP8WQW1_9PSEU
MAVLARSAALAVRSVAARNLGHAEGRVGCVRCAFSPRLLDTVGFLAFHSESGLGLRPSGTRIGGGNGG